MKLVGKWGWFRQGDAFAALPTFAPMLFTRLVHSQIRPVSSSEGLGQYMQIMVELLVAQA